MEWLFEPLLLFVVLLSAAAQLFFSNPKARAGFWSAWTGLVFSLGALGGLWFYATKTDAPHAYFIEWIGFSGSLKPLMAGFIVDRTFVVVASVLCLSVFGALWVRESTNRKSLPHPRLPAAFLALQAALLSWASGSVWLNLLSLFVVAYSAFLDRGRPSHRKEIVKHAKELSIGLTLVFGGVVMFMGLGFDGSWFGATETLSSARPMLFLIASIVFVLGVGIFTGMLPRFSGRDWSDSAITTEEVWIRLVAPAVTAAGLSWRLNQSFGTAELRMVMLFFGIASVFSLTFLGFIEPTWRGGFSRLVSAYFSFAYVVLGLGLNLCALFWIIGGAVGTLSLAVMGEAFDTPGADSESEKEKRATVPGYVIGLGVLALLAFLCPIGFLPARVEFSVLALSWSDTDQVVMIGAAFLCIVFLSWRLFFRISRTNWSPNLQTARLTFSFFSSLVLCAWFWTQDPTGWPNGEPLAGLGGFIGVPVSSGATVSATGDLLPAFAGAGVFVGGVLIAFFTRKKSMKRGARIIERADSFYFLVTNGLSAVGRAVYRFTFDFLWNEFLSPAAYRAFVLSAKELLRFDELLSNKLHGAARISGRGVSWLPRKIHSGDLQWYLLFVLGVISIAFLIVMRSIS